MKKILALVLAMLMLTLTACAVAEEVKVMTHEEYVAAELESEVTIEAYVQAKQSWGTTKPPSTCRRKTAHTSFTT